MYFHVDPDNYGRFLRPTKNITGIVTHTHTHRERKKQFFIIFMYPVIIIIKNNALAPVRLEC